MPRKIRKDATVGTAEKEVLGGLGIVRNLDGRKTRSDKLIDTIRKERKK